MWVRSRRSGCLFTWFCNQLITKPGNKTTAPSWSDPCTCVNKCIPIFHICEHFNLYLSIVLNLLTHYHLWSFGSTMTINLLFVDVIFKRRIFGKNQPISGGKVDFRKDSPVTLTTTFSLVFEHAEIGGTDCWYRWTARTKQQVHTSCHIWTER